MDDPLNREEVNMSALHTRAGDACELCHSTQGLQPYHVSPHTTESLEGSVLVCEVCAAQLVSGATLDDKHWFGLQESIWSEHAPVQVLSWRVLHLLRQHSWAQELLEQVYMEDETLAWAKSGISAEEDEEDVAPTLDSNGTVLAEGDAVTLIKDLNVKGAGFTAKRGTMVRNIRLTDNPEHVDGRVNGMLIVLKTCFLKKA